MSYLKLFELLPLLHGTFDLSYTFLAEDGFDPSTSGLWAQHASAAPLCCCRADGTGTLSFLLRRPVPYPLGPWGFCILL